MPLPIQLIVGLGNPGDQYVRTRHNAGFWFVEQLAQAASCSLRPETKFQGRFAEARCAAFNCRLLLPITYMNDSGYSVQVVCQYYKIPLEAILVVHDEIDLPPGVVRLKFDGGAGGHNGLQDIMDQLQTKQFHRLRIGVGHPGSSEAVADYVLSQPAKAERELIQGALDRAQDLLPAVLEGDFEKAMQRLHSE